MSFGTNLMAYSLDFLQDSTVGEEAILTGRFEKCLTLLICVANSYFVEAKSEIFNITFEFIKVLRRMLNEG